MCQWHTFSTDQSGSVEAHSPVNGNESSPDLCETCKSGLNLPFFSYIIKKL